MNGVTASCSTSFSVSRPTAVVNVSTGTVVAGSDAAGQYVLEALNGFKFSGSVEIPPGFGQGTWAFLQVVNSGDSISATRPYGNFHQADNGKPYLDLHFPVPENYDATGNPIYSFNPTGPTTYSFTDSPSDVVSLPHNVWTSAWWHPLWQTSVNILGELRNDSYTTYVMFLPPGTNSRWVPLKVVQWSWMGKVAAYDLVNQTAGWSLISHTDPKAGAIQDISTPPHQWSAAWQDKWIQG
jgi:hypothetical protein